MNYLMRIIYVYSADVVGLCDAMEPDRQNDDESPSLSFFPTSHDDKGLLMEFH